MKSGNSKSEEIDPKVLNWKFTCVKSHLFCYKFIIQILIKHNSTDLIGPLMSTNVITVAQRSFLVELLALNLPVKLSVYIVIDLFTENGPKILKLSFVKLVALISGWSPKVRFFIFCRIKSFFSLFFVIWERRNVRIEKKWRSGSHLTPERQYRSSENVGDTNSLGTFTTFIFVGNLRRVKFESHGEAFLGWPVVLVGIKVDFSVAEKDFRQKWLGFLFGWKAGKFVLKCEKFQKSLKVFSIT